MENSASIYALVDPRKPSEYRYIGQTAQRVKRRLAAHLSDATRGKISHKCNWIRKLIAEGVEPEIVVLEICSASELDSREIFWISNAKQNEQPLTNCNAGGNGNNGYSPTHEHRMRQREAMTGFRHSEESKRRISRTKTGIKASAEHVRRTREAVAIRKIIRGLKMLAELGVTVEFHESPEWSTSGNSGFLLENVWICSSCHGWFYGERDGGGLCKRCQNGVLSKAERSQSDQPYSSRYRGVSWSKTGKKWVASIGSGDKRLYLGSFANDADAARAYDSKSIELYGERAHLNFQ